MSSPDRPPVPPPPRWLLPAIIAAAVSVLLFMERGTTFLLDEWSVVLNRRTGFRTLVLPFNGHLTLVPLLGYRGLFAAAGLDGYWAFRLVGVLLHAATGALLFTWVRRRTGNALAAGATVLFLLLGYAWQTVLWPWTQWVFALPFALFLAMLLLFERRGAGPAAGAGALATVAIATSATALPLSLGVAAGLVWKRRWRDAAWLIPAFAAFGTWLVLEGPGDALSLGELPALPGFVAREAAAIVTGPSGVPLEGARLALGVVVAAVAAGGLVLYLVRARRVPAGLVPPLFALAGFWAVVALARGDLRDPSGSRYLYVSVGLALLLGAEIVAETRPGPGVRRAIGVALGAAITVNVALLVVSSWNLRSDAATIRAELGALELAGRALPEGFVIDPERLPRDFDSATYLAAIAELGSPASDVAAIEASSPADRAAADRVLQAASIGVEVPGVPDLEEAEPPPVEASQSVRTESEGVCLRVIPVGAGTVDVRLASGRLLIEAGEGGPVFAGLRRFADEFPTRDAIVAPGGTWLAITLDVAAAGPWHVRLGSAAPFRLCSIAA